MNNKKEKGITLIALVVTIVILLILAGISMTMVIGKNGIIKKAKDARENQVHSAVKEGIILSHNQYTIEDGTGESNSTTFKDYIEGKGIIDKNGIINVVNLLGKKQHLGNGSNTTTGDVYVFEESDDVYRVKYYDEKKEEHLIDEFEKGSTGEDWKETDPKYFEVDDDGTIRFKEEYGEAFYRGTVKWTEENLVIPEEIDGKKVTRIEWYGFTEFMSSVLKRVKIPDTVTYIGEGTFENCRELVSVKLSSSLTSIGGETFFGCSKLASISIPEGVTEIGDGAFGKCNKLISITIPSSVATIDYYAFGIESGDRLLKSIKVSKENKNYDSRNNCNALIETSTNTLVLGCNNTIIPDSVVRIINSAFLGCNQLKDIMIPASVMEIDYCAFLGCSGLSSVGVAAGNKNYDSRNDCNALIETSTNTLILGCSNTIIPDSIVKIGDYAFALCTELTDIVIPDSVVEIGDCAFSDSGLTSVTMPEKIKMIADYIFSGCSKLESITIPNSVRSIGLCAFEDCDSLKTINYTGTVIEWMNIEISNGNDALTNATIVYNYTPSNQ